MTGDAVTGCLPESSCPNSATGVEKLSVREIRLEFKTLKYSIGFFGTDGRARLRAGARAAGAGGGSECELLK